MTAGDAPAGVGFTWLIVVAVPVLLIGLVSLVGFFGRWFWMFDLAASFRPQFAAVLLGGGIALLLRSWPRLGWAILILGVINLAYVAPLFWGRQDIPAEAPTMRVVSFNVQGQNDQYDQVIEFLADVKADVVFLHEANRLWETAFSEARADGQLSRL